MPRIVLFGATGYTGRLTAEASVARGDRPVLAGRDPGRRSRRSPTSSAASWRPRSPTSPTRARSRALVEPGDVIVATVGPFARWGDLAAEAAIGAGARYLDSTGEPAFIRRVFEHFGAAGGAGGRRAGDRVRLRLGARQPRRRAGAARGRRGGDPGRRRLLHDRRRARWDERRHPRLGAPARCSSRRSSGGDGIRTERGGAAGARSSTSPAAPKPAISVGASEHFTLPRIHPGLREVNGYLGWFGSHSRPMQAVSAVNAGLTKIPGVKAGIGRADRARSSRPRPAARTPRRAPGPARRSSRSPTAPAGEELATVEVGGVNGYTFTGQVLAWGAAAAAGRRDREGRRARPGRGVRPRRARGRLRRGRDQPGRRLELRLGRGASEVAIEVELDPDELARRGTSRPPRWAARHPRRGGWFRSG